MSHNTRSKVRQETETKLPGTIISPANLPATPPSTIVTSGYGKEAELARPGNLVEESSAPVSSVVRDTGRQRGAAADVEEYAAKVKFPVGVKPSAEKKQVSFLDYEEPPASNTSTPKGRGRGRGIVVRSLQSSTPSTPGNRSQVHVIPEDQLLTPVHFLTPSTPSANEVQIREENVSDDEVKASPSKSKSVTKHSVLSRRSQYDSDSSESPEARPRHRRTSRHTKAPMKPMKFDGTMSVDTFIIQFETCAEYNDWDEREQVANLKCCLTGTAGQILWEAGDPSKLTYTELKEKLRARYGSVGQKEVFLSQLRARRRKPNESLSELYRDIRRLMALSYPSSHGGELHEEIAKSYFISAINDRVLELKVLEREPRDLDSAFTTAVRLEAYQNSYNSRDNNESGMNRGRNPDRNRVSTVGANSKSTNLVDDRIDQLQRELERERQERNKLSQELGVSFRTCFMEIAKCEIDWQSIFTAKHELIRRIVGGLMDGGSIGCHD